MACGLLTPQDCPVEWAGDYGRDLAEDGLEAAAGSMYGDLVAWLSEAMVRGLRMVAAGWTEMPSPVITGSDGAVVWMGAYLRPVVYVVLALSLMAAGVRLAWEQRGEDARELAWALLRYVLVVGLGASVVELLAAVGDAYTVWILDATTRGVAGDSVSARVALLLRPLSMDAATEALLAFMFVALIIASLVQIVMIYARFVLLVLMVVMLPVVAAAALTKSGKSMLQRYLAWGLAWVLLKPVAATIYATGFALIGLSDSDTSVIAGLATFVLAPFALPAMTRLLAPATAALGGVGGGGVAGAMGVAGAAIGAAGSLAAAGGGGRGAAADSGAMRVRDATHGVPSGAGVAGPAGPAKQPPAGAGRAGSGAAGGAAGAAAGAAAGPAGAAAAVRAGAAGVRVVSDAANNAAGAGEPT